MNPLDDKNLQLCTMSIQSLWRKYLSGIKFISFSGV